MSSEALPAPLIVPLIHAAPRKALRLDTYTYTCNTLMKWQDLERRFRGMGWRFKQHGSNHDIWTDGNKKMTIPRHNEINEMTARDILKRAEKGNR